MKIITKDVNLVDSITEYCDRNGITCQIKNPAGDDFEVETSVKTEEEQTRLVNYIKINQRKEGVTSAMNKVSESAKNFLSNGDAIIVPSIGSAAKIIGTIAGATVKTGASSLASIYNAACKSSREALKDMQEDKELQEGYRRLFKKGDKANKGYTIVK